MDATTRATSTTACCWVSRAQWHRPNSTSCAAASRVASSTRRKRASCAFRCPSACAMTTTAASSWIPMTRFAAPCHWCFVYFQETGSAYAVVKRFAESGYRFPKRAYGGAWAGRLIWGRLSHGRVIGLIKNPSYSGVYVFGRYQYRKTITPAGEVRKRVQPVPKADWRVHLPEHHEGYITPEEFERNQARLARNRTNGEGTVLSGPAREGLALLQGLLICGCCGRALTVRYQGNGGLYPLYLCSAQRRQGLATTDCMSVRSDLLDNAIGEAV